MPRNEAFLSPEKFPSMYQRSISTGQSWEIASHNALVAMVTMFCPDASPVVYRQIRKTMLLSMIGSTEISLPCRVVLSATDFNRSTFPTTHSTNNPAFNMLSNRKAGVRMTPS